MRTKSLRQKFENMSGKFRKMSGKNSRCRAKSKIDLNILGVPDQLLAIQISARKMPVRGQNCPSGLKIRGRRHFPHVLKKKIYFCQVPKRRNLIKIGGPRDRSWRAKIPPNLGGNRPKSGSRNTYSGIEKKRKF